jgi:uncharacterized membrane protein
MLEGSRTVEIDAPLARVREIAIDVENAPDWQGSLKAVEVLERDEDGRATLVETTNDAKVKSVKVRLRFTLPNDTDIEWVQEKGDLKSLTGGWRFEELGSERTRATYWLEADPGRMLGMLLRGPAEGKVRDALLGDAAAGLKRTAEAG